MISDEAVEAAAMALRNHGWLGSWPTPESVARAALAAAEPLMHEGWEPVGAAWKALVFSELEALRAENARLREALGSCGGFISGCRDDYTPGEWRESRAHRLCLEIAAALAPSTEEGA